MQKVFLSLTLLLSLLLPQSAFAATYEEDLYFVKNAFKDKFYDVAENKLKEMNRSDLTPNQKAQIKSLLAQSYYYQNKFREALVLFEELQTKSDSLFFKDEMIYWSAECYYQLSDIETAFSLYEQILESFPDSSFTPHVTFSHAWCLFLLGEFDQSIARFKKFISNYPDHPLSAEIYHNLGQIYFEEGKYKEAIEALHQQIDTFPLSPKSLDARYLLGGVYFAEGDIDEAIHNYTLSIEGSKDVSWRPYAIFQLGIAHFTLNEYEKAAKYFSQSAEEAAETYLVIDSLNGHAQSLFHLKQFDNAIELYDQILSQFTEIDEEEMLEALYWKAQCAYEKGDYVTAQTLYVETIDRFPESTFNDDMQYNLAWSYQMTGKVNEAREIFEKLSLTAQSSDSRVNALLRLGDIYEDKGSFEESLNYYDRVLHDYPDNFNADYAQYQIGIMLSHLKDLSGAELAFRALLLNFSDSFYKGQAQFQLGNIYFKKGEYESAVEIFKQLAQDESGNLKSRARLKLGDCYYNQSRYDDALKVYKFESLEAATEDLRQQSFYKIAWAHYRKGEHRMAVERFKEFLQKYPDKPISTEVLLWLGEYYFYKENFNAASIYFEKLIKEFPNSKAKIEALYYLSLTLLKTGLEEDAIKMSSELVGLSPDNEYTHQTLFMIGDYFKKKKDFIQAKNFYIKVLNLNPHDSAKKLIHRNIANILLNTGNAEEALQHYNFALHSNDREIDAQVYFQIGLCLEEMGEVEKAAQKYLEIDYEYKDIDYWRVKGVMRCANLFEKEGKFDQAITLYKKIKAMDVFESTYASERIMLLLNQISAPGNSSV